MKKMRLIGMWMVMVVFIVIISNSAIALETLCSDGTDNDGDGDTDCYDSDCTSWINTGNVPGFAKSLIQALDGSIYAARTSSGVGYVYKSTNAGASWANTGVLEQDVLSLLQVSDGAIYAGTGKYTDGNVYKYDGLSWSGTGNLAFSEYVTSLLQTSDDVIYAGTYWGVNGGYVYKSTNGGASWANTADLPGAQLIQSLIQASDGTIYAGTGENDNIFKCNPVSTNGCSDAGSWVNAANLPGATYVFSLLQASDGTIYAGTSPNGDVFKCNPVSTNGCSDAGSWVNTANLLGVTSALSLIQTIDGAIYVGTSPNGDVFKSEDVGGSWVNVGNLIPSYAGQQHVYSLIQATDGAIYASTYPGDIFKLSCPCAPQPYFNNCDRTDGCGIRSTSPYNSCDLTSDTSCGTETFCDGIDNNCDLSIDEAFPDKGQSCNVGVGVCEATGTYVCKADNTDTECNAVEGSPTLGEESIELSCDDFADNDCDGLADDMDPDCCVCNDNSCNAANNGQICDGCNYVAAPAEICDFVVDEDCDGLIDTADPDCIPVITPSVDCGLSYFDPAINGTSVPQTGSIDLSWTRQSSMYPIEYYLAYSTDNIIWHDIAVVSELEYTWDFTNLPFGVYTVRLIPRENGGRNAFGKINTTTLLVGSAGRITGYVKCGETPLPNANVRIVGSTASGVTDALGYYEIDGAPVPSGTVIASYSGSATRHSDYEGLVMGGTYNLDFTTVCPVTLDCTASCTLLQRDICMLDCWGFEDESGDSCDLSPLCAGVKQGLLISIDPYTKIRCCEGEVIAVSEDKTRFELNETLVAEDIIRTTRIVYIDGKPVKMIVTAWS